MDDAKGEAPGRSKFWYKLIYSPDLTFSRVGLNINALFFDDPLWTKMHEANRDKHCLMSIEAPSSSPCHNQRKTRKHTAILLTRVYRTRMVAIFGHIINTRSIPGLGGMIASALWVLPFWSTITTKTNWGQNGVFMGFVEYSSFSVHPNPEQMPPH